jgi:hypothetical protein
MPWQELKKLISFINRQLKNLKILLATPISNHVNKKIMFAAIIILTVIVLSTVIKDIGSNNSVVKAESVTGIGVGIYWDEECTNRTHSLNWGSIEASSTNNLTVYVRNEYYSAVSLQLRTSNWTPSAASRYMSLNWNYTGQVLRADEVIPIELTLNVYPTINDIIEFNFETIITTTGEY